MFLDLNVGTPLTERMMNLCSRTLKASITPEKKAEYETTIAKNMETLSQMEAQYPSKLRCSDPFQINDFIH